jgi:hypothetical protein
MPTQKKTPKSSTRQQNGKTNGIHAPAVNELKQSSRKSNGNVNGNSNGKHVLPQADITFLNDEELLRVLTEVKN